VTEDHLPPASQAGGRPGAVLADQPARDRIRSNLDATLVVEAAAGTGKTTALVGRMVAALMAGRAQLDRVVAVTFTELAAGELKLRLRTEIERARRDPATEAVARARLTDALPQLEEARIGTIHSFCSEILRERPVEAGVDPLFEIAPEDVASDLFQRAFERWFEKQLTSPSSGVRRVLRRRTRDGVGPRELLRSAAWGLAERRDFRAPWRRAPFDRDRAIDALIDEMAALGTRAAEGDPEDYFTRSLAEISQFVSEVTRREAIRGRDYDGLEAELIELRRAKHWRWLGFNRTRGDFPKAELRTRRDALLAQLVAFIDAAGADLAPSLREELWPVLDRYESLKGRAGRVDFLDLLLITRDLLRGDAAVRRDLQARFTHLFVDEFQDTDPLQAEILLLLAAGDPAERDWTRVRPVPGKLFMVGDPKQSIYRFRRAEVALYETVKRRLVDAGASVEHLTVSFRAAPDIQAAVNAAFAPRMAAGSPGQAAYVPLVPFRDAVTSQPAVVVLPVPAPYGDYGSVVDWKIEASLPDAVAAFVDWLVRSSGWTVTEREQPGCRVALEPRHVCLLFRRFRSWGRDVTREYVRALEARHLPHVLVGGSSFHEREEVEAIRNALAAIERPEDDLAVFATLRGPFFALGDAALLAFRERFTSLHSFRRLPDDLPEPLAEVASALTILRELHRGRNRRPLADTISRLLAATRAHAGVASWPTGEQALANVTRLMDLARRAERSGAMSFRAFVERLHGEAARGEASDAPIIEEGTGGVRVMTVHRAKGLEFSVVLLADLTANETPSEPARYTDPERGLCALRLAGCAPPELLEHRGEELEREREEAARILYVAATRARDLLMVPAVGDARHDGWLGALTPALYPDEALRRQPVSRQPPGCPAFGLDSVAERPPRAPGRERSVAPGLHRPEAGTHQVVWWDPAVLTLNVEETVGLRQQRLLEADESRTRAEGGIQAHAAWQRERVRVRAAAASPSLRVATATEWAARAAAPKGTASPPLTGAGRVPTGIAPTPTSGVAPGGEAPAMSAAAVDTPIEITVEEIGGAGPGPHGKRFGTLVHALLAAVDLDADHAAVTAMAALQARLFGADAEEIDAAVAIAERTLAHSWLRRAAAAARSGRCRRETPITLQLRDGTLIEGVVDVAFAEADGVWTVLDFKTDVEIESRLEEYHVQVGLYARAIARATGAPVRAVLLRV
jgi:ATP-dependent exoDNAse (exonuclease V) beta subunit